MASVEKSIEVQVPLRTAYNQWTQFEEFPQFMEGIEEVRQIDDERIHWVADVSGHKEEWDARIIEQYPDQRISWMSEGGSRNAGIVTFNRVDDGCTRVSLQMDYEPRGVKEKAGDVLGFVTRRVQGDLERFKEFIEERRTETGAYRGTIE